MAAPILGYEVRYRPANTGAAWQVESFGPDSTTIKLRGIPDAKRGQQYDAEARSIGPNGLNSAWVPATFIVADATTTPLAPYNLTAVSVADGVALKWVVDEAQRADVEYIVQRATSSGGTYTDVARVRANQWTDPLIDANVYWYRVKAISFAGISSGFSNVVSENGVAIANLQTDIANAMQTAQNAQAAADGSIDIFYQPTAPVGKLGDYWQDTDDGKKWYRYNGSAWAEATDDRIPQAITAANAAAGAATAAQATADSKIKLFAQEAQPTPTSVGDQWYQPSTRVTRYWNGSGWSALNEDAAQSVSDLVVNGNFEAGVDPSGEPIGWANSGATITYPSYGAQFGVRSCRMVNTIQYGGIYSRKTYSCAEGDRHYIAADIWKLTGAPFQLLLGYYNAAGEIFSGLGITVTIDQYFTKYSATVTAPAGATSFRLIAQHTSTAFGGDAIIDNIVMSRLRSLDNEIADGAVYGRFAVDDRIYAGDRYRLGLRIPGSSHRIGDQRNLPQSNTTAYGSIRNTTALTATSAGAVSVNAHTVRYGGTSVSYSAVSNAVTGIAQGTTVVIYCFDEAYSGGVRTWYAGTNPDAVMQLGDGVVVAGQVTIPTSGSSGGGGGGGGSNPGDWCVDWDAVLPDGRLVRELQPGDLVPCWDGRDAAGVDQVPLRAIGFGEEACFELVSATGRITQSASTPMDTRDGRIVRTPDMLGEYVLTFDGLRWEPVTAVIPAGARRVVKPDLGNRMFFAGDSAASAIATHNVINKP